MLGLPLSSSFPTSNAMSLPWHGIQQRSERIRKRQPVLVIVTGSPCVDRSIISCHTELSPQLTGICPRGADTRGTNREWQIIKANSRSPGWVYKQKEASLSGWLHQTNKDRATWFCLISSAWKKRNLCQKTFTVRVRASCSINCPRVVLRKHLTQACKGVLKIFDLVRKR